MPRLPAPVGPAVTPTMVPAPPGPFNRTTVFLDVSHGGTDSGSRINDSTSEKDVTLQFANKLRSLLTARGFTTVLSRDSDTATLPNSPDAPLTLDARAGMGNRARAVACLLLHATGSGHGVHLYSSELTPTSGEISGGPWLTAQAPWVTQSVKLERQLGQAITREGVPLVVSRASVRPVDSLTCPALVVELAPSGSESGSISDDAYQQRIANAIATALVFWQNTAQPPSRLVPAPALAPPPTVGPVTKGSLLP